MADGHFTALDWEDSLRHGFPLWDAACFLTDALAHLDCVESEEERAAHFSRLFRGELESSRILARGLRQVAEASGVPAEAFGRLITLCWLHHALSHRARFRWAELLDTCAKDPGTVVADRVRIWLETPGLGSGWRLPE